MLASGGKQEMMIFVPGSQFVVIHLSREQRSPPCCVRVAVKSNPRAYLGPQLCARFT